MKTLNVNVTLAPLYLMSYLYNLTIKGPPLSPLQIVSVPKGPLNTQIMSCFIPRSNAA